MASINISSEELNTKSPLRNLFSFLTDFNNFKSLLPEDKIENFQCSGDSCSFNVRGITPLAIKITDKREFTLVKYQLTGMAKYTFVMQAHLKGNAEQAGIAVITLDGDMNPFIKAMAQKPLENLVNTMNRKLANLEV